MMRGNISLGKRLRTFSFLVLLGLCASVQAQAADLPVASGSPLIGISFDDQPLQLPVQRNFQMAMLTASGEIGRSCGEIEAYGWRLGQDEQKRVDQIFNATVDKMRAQGFVIETNASKAVARDVTVFTADRSDKHLVFMWSAGEIGLVMVACETSAPVGGRLGQLTSAPTPRATPPQPQRETPPVAMMPSASRASSAVEALHAALRAEGHEPVYSHSSLSARDRVLVPVTKPTAAPHMDSFSPKGDWVGTYTCNQGVTGGTLSITKVQGTHFEGTFRFYPTARNPSIPSGGYRVSGDYDASAQRLLINPGAWIQRPRNFYNTIMLGTFDPDGQHFSGFFQGITGCTSFEASYRPSAEPAKSAKKVQKKAKHHAAKKVPAPTLEAVKLPIVSVPTSAPAAPVTTGIKVEDPSLAKPVAPAAPTPTPAAH